MLSEPSTVFLGGSVKPIIL